MVEVISSGIYTTIQDFGRLGYQYIGVPVSGVMDKRAARLANSLIGNSEELAVLEITMLGPKLKFNTNTAIAITGADISPLLNGEAIHQNSFISITSGDVLNFGKLTKGFRCYVAVVGGFQEESVLGSKSMYVGVTANYTVKKGDVLQITKSDISKKHRYSSLKIYDEYLVTKALEVYKGPEFDRLSKEEQEKLLSQEFTISKDNSRMGYQLVEALENNLKPIITSPVISGTVQLTPSGKLIVLMRDCQTTGGYPRVLQLSKMAINILAQKFTGGKLVFKLKA